MALAHLSPSFQPLPIRFGFIVNDNKSCILEPSLGRCVQDDTPWCEVVVAGSVMEFNADMKALLTSVHRWWGNTRTGSLEYPSGDDEPGGPRGRRQ